MIRLVLFPKNLYFSQNLNLPLEFQLNYFTFIWYIKNLIECNEIPVYTD